MGGRNPSQLRMSVDYKAVLMYGVRFDSRPQIVDYINENLTDTVEQTQAVKDEIDDSVSDGNEVELDGEELLVECLNCYTGNEWVLGWNIDVGADLPALREKWNRLFPNCPKQPDVILDVKAW